MQGESIMFFSRLSALVITPIVFVHSCFSSMLAFSRPQNKR
jgi:hypothetical protein